METVVEGDPKAPFPISTTSRCRGGPYSFPWIALLYPWYVPYIAKCWARRYQVLFLKSLVWHDLGLNTGLPDQWRTLYPLDQWYIYVVNFSSQIVGLLSIIFFHSVPLTNMIQTHSPTPISHINNIKMFRRCRDLLKNKKTSYNQLYTRKISPT